MNQKVFQISVNNKCYVEVINEPNKDKMNTKSRVNKHKKY